MLRQQLRIGRIFVDRVDRQGALEAIGALVDGRRGGYVFTPNVDHVVLAEDLDELSRAYHMASLSLADGMPILWASRLLGHPLPEKISGSDLVEPVVGLAAREGWSVYVLGGAPGAAELAAQQLLERHPSLDLVGLDAPMLSTRRGDPAVEEAFGRVRRVKPDILLVAMSGPKQELLIHRATEALGSTVTLGVGAGIDFLAGVQRRAPAWMSRAGLEWFYRLTTQPRRLWHRYLVRDPRFIGVLWRTLRLPAMERVRLLPLRA